jgi:hypothetical protein
VSARSRIPGWLREDVRNRANSCCEYCRIPEEEFLAATVFQAEHIIAQVQFKKGDPRCDSPDNLALACPRCNQHKYKKTSGTDPATGEIVSLFNPRTQSWSTHFLAQPSGHISGLTSEGRATVKVLKFNDCTRVKGRLSLYLRGLWPGF